MPAEVCCRIGVLNGRSLSNKNNNATAVEKHNSDLGHFRARQSYRAIGSCIELKIGGCWTQIGGDDQVSKMLTLAKQLAKLPGSAPR